MGNSPGNSDIALIPFSHLTSRSIRLWFTELHRAGIGADILASKGLVPAESAADALHIAIAATNGVDFLLTWNCKHLANAAHRQRIEQFVEEADYGCPIICTPEELMED